ncbi:MAG: hypothetical protein SGBAC_004105 [Bacillariaceae sp.]
MAKHKYSNAVVYSEEEQLRTTISKLQQSGHINESIKGLLLERNQQRIQDQSSNNIEERCMHDTFIEPCSCFHFIWKGSQHPIAFIRVLKDCKIQSPGAFCIYDPVWSEDLLSALIDIFCHFAKKGIYWNTLVLGHHNWEHEAIGSASCFDCRYTRPLLFIANALNLFKRFEFWGESRILANSSAAAGDATIFSGLELNIRLEAILLQVSRGMTEGDHQALTRTLKRSTKLKDLVLRCSDLNHNLLCEGLAQNTTLLNIDLDFRQPDRENGALMGMILDAIAKHPKVKKLELATGHRFGDYSSELGALVASSKSLEELALVGCTDKYFLNTDTLLRGLRATRSLRKLTIVSSLAGDLIFSKFLRMLQESGCSLQVLSLWYLISENDLECLHTMPRLSRPVEVEFHNRDLRINGSQLKEVLQCHPEIRMFGGIPNNLEHITDLNWYGRYLLNKPATPLALWSQVLKNVNHKPSVLYEWLKGPAFAARDGYL